MTTTPPQVRVREILGAKKYESSYFLYVWPSMQLHEEGSRWLATGAKNQAASQQRNNAYAIAYWLTYCLAAGIEFRDASVENLVDYKVALGNVISQQTGDNLAAGTLRIRLSVAIAFYVHGKRFGWYRPAWLNSKEGVSTDADSVDVEISSDCLDLLPKHESTRTNIRPLTPTELKAVLKELSWTSNETSGIGSRDRLIAEWLCYVGLRISEVIGTKKDPGLSTESLLALKPNKAEPMNHCALEVVGKFRKKRSVAVPNWLISRTQEYILACDEKTSERQGTGAVFLAVGPTSSLKQGRAISIRRYQRIFSDACKKAGLCRSITRRGESSDRVELVAKHSPHDLRHTYAIMTYFAERELGNPEPWKPIQAQLGHKSLLTTVDTYLDHVKLFTQWGKDLSTMSMRELAGLQHAAH